MAFVRFEPSCSDKVHSSIALLLAVGSFEFALKGSNIPGTMKGSSTSHLYTKRQIGKKKKGQKAEKLRGEEEKSAPYPPMLTPRIKCFS